MRKETLFTRSLSSIKEIAEAYVEGVTSITNYVLLELRTVLVAREEIIH